MTATSLVFNNRLTRVPGAQSRVNASGLDAPGPGSLGRVALLGTAEGGVPVGQLAGPSAVLSYSQVESFRHAFRSGDLLEAGAIAFAPARDANISGAQEVIPMKVDPALAGSVTLSNANGAAITLTSRDYGPHVNQIHVSIAAGSVQGRLITVQFESVTETRDNVGGAAFATLQYTQPPALADGWDTMTLDVLSSGLRANATRAELGRATELLNPSTTGAVEIVSSNVADIGQVVSIYGVAGGIPVVRTAVLNGTTIVVVSGVFDVTAIYGVSMSATALGTVTVRHTTGPTNLFQMTAGQQQRGGVLGQTMYLAGVLATLVADAATTALVFIAGRNAAGTVVLETIALAGAVPVNTVTTTWAQIDFIGLAAVAAARTVTMSGSAVVTLNTTQSTLIAARDHFNARQLVVASVTYGFVFTLATTRTTFLVSQLDRTATGVPINIYNPATGSLTADLQQIVEFFQNESQLVTGVAAGGAIGAPSNTVAPVYLSGGAAGVATLADYQTALDLLRFLDVDTIVPLTGDPAVHAAVIAHLDYMSGPGKRERDAKFGILNAGLTDVPTRTEILARIPSYNNRNVSATGQAMTRINTLGASADMLPPFVAAMLAGIQAGGAVGLPGTHKILNCESVRSHATWNPITNAEEMIAAGLVVLEDVPVIGRRIVRSVTTNASASNLAFNESSVNQAVNFAVRTLRDDLENLVGQPGFRGTLGALFSRAKNRLNFLVSQNVLVSWKNLQGVLVLDQAQVTVDVAPVLPINFVPITVNLFTAPIAA